LVGKKKRAKSPNNRRKSLYNDLDENHVQKSNWEDGVARCKYGKVVWSPMSGRKKKEAANEKRTPHGSAKERTEGEGGERTCARTVNKGARRIHRWAKKAGRGGSGIQNLGKTGLKTFMDVLVRGPHARKDRSRENPEPDPIGNTWKFGKTRPGREASKERRTSQTSPILKIGR